MPFKDHDPARPIAYLAYRALTTSVFAAAVAPLWLYAKASGRGGDLTHRLGRYPPSLFAGMPADRRIWLHAASVGEVSVAAAIIDALAHALPGWALILSTTTEQGQAVARETLAHRATCLYAPVDFIGAVNHALGVVRPRVLACIETEIWPNWLMAARRRGVRTALVNGRVSIRSIGGYLRIRPLMRAVLAGVDAFSMISDEDAQRVRRIGAPLDRIVVNGNAKFDRLAHAVDPAIRAAMQRLFCVPDGGPVFVAGSTRGDEPAMMIEAFRGIRQRFGDALMIIAPRHLERVRAIAERLRAQGLAYHFRTELDAGGNGRRAPVVILDTVGELSAAYSIADVVFCGGSLVPLGGQNVLEAAVWGKPVFYGPSMEDFADARQLLERSGGGVRVENAADLARAIIDCLTVPGRAEAMGRAAAATVPIATGAARKHAAVIRRLALD
ncbi:MAG: hypothetical protein JEZ11_23840 [Desulfobacterales bacterium]|nr:hypothetical protein [Desulfobacterales bacterium]